MTTRAIRFLEKKKVPFAVRRYDHEEKGARFAASAIGFPLEQTVKTLVVDLGRGGYALALMPGHRQLDLKKLALVCGAKRAAMADMATAERLTGYRVGGISPFGTRQRLSPVMEEGLMTHDRVMINAGQRGVMLEMAPADIGRALGGLVADLVKKS